MKLSELSNDKALDIICDITPYIGEIVEDKELIKLMAEKVKLKADATEQDFKEISIATGIKKALAFVPLLLKKHREEVYNILAIVNNKKIEEYREQKLVETIREIKDLVLDPDFLDLVQEFTK